MSEPKDSRPTLAAAVWRTIARAPRIAGRGLVRVYRYTLSPLIGYDCRHLPTCSHYSEEAIDRFGLWAGGWMALARITRCQVDRECQIHSTRCGSRPSEKSFRTSGESEGM